MPPVSPPGLQHPPPATSSRPSGLRRRPAGSRGPTAAKSRDAALARVRFRRALTLLLMTLVLPGSAQLVVGRKSVGRLAVRIWLGCLAAVGVVVALGLLWPGLVFSLASNTFVLGMFRLLLCVVALGWALLFLDAWRLGRPLELQRRQRLVMVGLNALLCFLVAGTLLFASHLVAVQRGFISAMFGDGAASAAEHGRYNVLLIGGDAGKGRWGLRTDSLTVASVDEDTGRTVLFSLPRNMTGFPFPEGSVLAEQFPDGFDCDGCMLNGLATWAAEHKELFEGVDDPGMQATIAGVEGITGLRINYYAMVNLAGFRSLVDAMGGLTLNVRDPIPIEVPVERYIEPGIRKLDGYETLWFARSRESADDYSRMARQKCVMSAMLQQLSPSTVITRFESLARAGENLVETNLPASELDTFAQLALKARSQPLATVSFVPPVIDTADPDIAKIRSMVADAIDRSEGGGGADGGGADGGGGERGGDRAATGETGGKGFSRKAGAGTTGGSIGSLSRGYAANHAEDLSRAC